jgi:uncharacterized membrane protein YhhN
MCYHRPGDMTIWLLFFWACIFAVLTVWTYYKGPRLLYLAFRPLTMAVIIGLVVAAFLVAQVCYAFAFQSGIRLRLSPVPALALLAYGAVLFAILSPALKRMRVPVLVYILAISAMALAALERYGQLGGPAALAACAGAFLFLSSDSVLAVDRFVRPFRAAQGAILATYFAAQALIALSTAL